MTDHLVKFDISTEPVVVSTGTLLTEAARKAGIDLNQPCGGQGRCGRCIVKIDSGNARRRSTLRLSVADIEQGFALACQTVIEGDISVSVPPQEKIERRLTTDRTVGVVTVPEGYDFKRDQMIRRVLMELSPPSMDDQTDDLSRLLTALRQQANISEIEIPYPILKKMGGVLREKNWQITAIIHFDENSSSGSHVTLVDIIPGYQDDSEPIWGMAIDIGTTTVTVWLVDLVTGQVGAQVAEYNGQINRGEDVISRIIYACKDGGANELQELVLGTIHELIDRACKRVGGLNLHASDIVKATVTGNSTMIHLFLQIPPASIRLSPFITAVNNPPILKAHEIGLKINPAGIIDCIPGVASYVGADVTAGVYSSKMDATDKITLFMDVGTNGEIVLGSCEWLVTCACSAGPAFEGAGVLCGMRATKGAIEEVWINGETFEPSFRVIGGGKPKGICGSGLIALLAEMFITGVIDKGGNLKTNKNTERVREGEHGLEYVIAYGPETEHGVDIFINAVDIDNLIRAKAAIYAGYQVLAESVGVPLEMTEQMYIGGSFGKYINVEKAIQIGLLPDMSWEKFHFLGNTSVQGAYLSLLDKHARKRIAEIASRMTYIELSLDNRFFEAFTSALFLPHTDLSKFASVAAGMKISE